MDKITKTTLDKMRAILACQGIKPTILIIRATSQHATKIACALGAAWDPDSKGQQKIGDYLIISCRQNIDV